ncbi:phytoene desaturase family protein [Amycolatopsis kentuckyensis]|uniref:phytoene desaturase family protein n=1 Tax=Amycolatopsis kentuckyensis TaxID=218823 RepID=UPI000A3D24E8|nr:NAD(P)/FAD-dependent oxidoreductase [Amycolatopsis kentuckyensis]
MNTEENAAGRWDAIVVGSGIGGLVCAGYLVASGMRVLVLEQHDVAGGNSHVFRRRRAYQFDVGVHYLGDCGPDGLLPRVLSGLGLGDRVRFHPMDPDGFDRIVLPSVTVDVPTGWDRYADRLRAALPAEAEGITRYIDICAAVAQACRQSAFSAGPVAKVPAVMLRWGRRTLAQLFDHCGLSARARTILAAQSGNYGSAPASTLVAAHAGMLGEYLRGAYYPEGGGQVIAASFVELLESHGGTLLTRTRVDRILIERGKATGVRLSDGTVHRAPVVVSNADYCRTVLELCGGRENLPEPVVTRAETAKMRLPMAVCYVGLDRELPVDGANIWCWPDEDVDAAYARVESGRLDELPYAFLSFASHKDPVPGSACPPGHTNFQIMTTCPPGYAHWGLAEGPANGARYRREPAYLGAKNRLTEQMLDLAEAAIGPFRQHLVHAETSTPLTQERYTLSTGGSAYGLHTWGRVGQRPDIDSGVDGLYLTGQSILHGGGIVGVATGGALCASTILGRPVLADGAAGVRGNPELLPVREPGWDPLRTSRGLRRREARGLALLDRVVAG